MHDHVHTTISRLANFYKAFFSIPMKTSVSQNYARDVHTILKFNSIWYTLRIPEHTTQSPAYYAAKIFELLVNLLFVLWTVFKTRNNQDKRD